MHHPARHNAGLYLFNAGFKPFNKMSHDPIRAIAYEIYEINERILTGDIFSNAMGMNLARNKIREAIRAFKSDEIKSIAIQPYCAAGGWIGIMYSYRDKDNMVVEGSFIPRRIER